MESNRSSDSTIYVGKKGVMSYVLAVVTQFNAGADEVVIKARGKTISRAVDVLEIVKNKFIQEVIVEGISSSTDDMVSDEGRTTKVSTIKIVLRKPPTTKSEGPTQ